MAAVPGFVLLSQEMFTLFERVTYAQSASVATETSIVGIADYKRRHPVNRQVHRSVREFEIQTQAAGDTYAQAVVVVDEVHIIVIPEVNSSATAIVPAQAIHAGDGVVYLIQRADVNIVHIRPAAVTNVCLHSILFAQESFETDGSRVTQTQADGRFVVLRECHGNREHNGQGEE